MSIIVENNTEYEVFGDYPNGSYVKQIKDKGTPPSPKPSIEDRISAIEEKLKKLDDLAAISAKLDVVKSDLSSKIDGVK